MKKFLSLFLAVVMVLVISVPAFAAETGPFKIGETYYATLDEAIANAAAGDTIVMTEDVSYSGTTQNQYTITKNLTIDGGGHNLTLTCSAANVFPFAVNGDITVTFTNFGTISSTGGGFDCKAGTLKITNLNAQSKGRVCIKTTSSSTAEIIVENATISNTADAGADETAAILGGSGTNTITLKNGAVIQKNNPANSAANGAAAVIYTTNTGTHTINMEAGSKIVANHASGNATGTIIGYNASKSLTLNIADGAYLVVDSANLSTVNFIHSSLTSAINLTAPDGAYLVKTGLTPTLNSYQGGANDSGKIYNMVEATSAVDGYNAYKLAVDTNVDYDFEIITSDNASINVAGSFSDALNTATTGSTIKLLKDHTTTVTGLSLTKNITVDLNNFTFNANGTNYLFSSVKSGLTFKNGTMNITRGIIVYDGGHLAFDNVTATAIAAASSNQRPMVKLSGAGATKLTVKDSTLESKSSIGESLILVEQKTNGTIDVSGNSVIKYSGAVGSLDQNHAAIAVQQAWANGQSDPGDGSWNTDLVLNVGAGSSIVVAHSSSTKEGKNASAIVDQTNGDITINLADGAILKAERTLAEDNVTKTHFIYTMKADGALTVNNEGASFVVNADVAKQGIALPATTYGYAIGETEITLAEGNVYQNAEATEAVTITTVFYSFTPVMIPGASIRLELPFGLRFGATIDEATYNKILELDPNAEFGFVIAKKGDAGTKFDTTTMMESKYTLQKATGIEKTDSGYTFVTSVYVGDDSIISAADKNGFKTNVAAKAYIKATVNGQEVIYFSEYKMSDNSRSLYKVAQYYYEDTVNGSTENVVINYIIATAES